MSNSSILIVDDSRTQRLLLKKILEKKSTFTNIVEAENGEEAMVCLNSSEPFSCIISDLNMPKMGGVELTKLIKKSEKLSKIAVILASDDKEKSELLQGMIHGARSFLIKPYSTTKARIDENT